MRTHNVEKTAWSALMLVMDQGSVVRFKEESFLCWENFVFLISYQTPFQHPLGSVLRKKMIYQLMITDSKTDDVLLDAEWIGGGELLVKEYKSGHWEKLLHYVASAEVPDFQISVA